MIDLASLSDDVAHLAILVHAYSGEDMDDLYDASVFVADPSAPGTGPGALASSLPRASQEREKSISPPWYRSANPSPVILLDIARSSGIRGST